MTTPAPQVDLIVYGSIADVEAEYGLVEMGQEWLDQNGFKFVVKILGDTEWDVNFHTHISHAKADARELAAHFGVRTTRL